MAPHTTTTTKVAARDLRLWILPYVVLEGFSVMVDIFVSIVVIFIAATMVRN
jgi:hypothetical protein